VRSARRTKGRERATESADTEPLRARRRRTPEEARRLILDAASSLFAERGPDAVGLEDVAHRAGVSHALVSHYFGTYEGLVETTLERHAEQRRADLVARILGTPPAGSDANRTVAAGASADKGPEGPERWVERCFDMLSDPLHTRLATWAAITGRLRAEEFFARRRQGLRVVTDAIAARLRADGVPRVRREEVDIGVALVYSAAVGYSLLRDLLWASLGKTASAE
jgi:AcrR family transcriptional regulator